MIQAQFLLLKSAVFAVKNCFINVDKNRGLCHPKNGIIVKNLDNNCSYYHDKNLCYYRDKNLGYYRDKTAVFAI